MGWRMRTVVSAPQAGSHGTSLLAGTSSHSRSDLKPSNPVSVVMRVHNALPYLDAAIRSILDQTFGEFEFLIRDDGSTDGSTEVLRKWAGEDRRIRLFEDRQRLGPAGSGNWIVRRATAPLVANMDADDISHPDRLRRQLQVFEDNPDVDLVGTLWTSIDHEGRPVRPRD